MGPGPKVEFYQDDAHEWRWRVKGGNGEIVASSGEGFGTEHDAIRSFLRAVDLLAEAQHGWVHS